jgi:hypothetical protein
MKRLCMCGHVDLNHNQQCGYCGFCGCQEYREQPEQQPPSQIGQPILVIQTAEYPTRYVAFNTPGVLVEQTHPPTGGGFELAVYTEPRINPDYPHLIDGIYAEIVIYQKIGNYLVSVHATMPNRGRRQNGCSQQVNFYVEAKTLLLKGIAEMQAWLKEGELEL